MGFCIRIPQPFPPKAVADSFELAERVDGLMRLLGVSCLSWRVTEQGPGRFTFVMLVPGDEQAEAAKAFESARDLLEHRPEE